MENLEPMQIRLLWYVLAGFVLGFITSTLWEWLYFRGVRLRRTDQGPYALQDSQDVTTAWQQEQTFSSSTNTSGESEHAAPWGAPAYRSSGVFLESERELAEPYNTPIEPPLFPAPLPAARSAPSVDPGFQNRSNVPQPAVEPGVQRLDSTVSVGVAQPARVQAVSTPTVQPAACVEADEIAVPEQSRLASEATIPAALPPTELYQNTQPLRRPDPYANVGVAPIEPSDALPAPVQLTVAQGSANRQSGSGEFSHPQGHPDDLTHIPGIGEAYKRRLYAARIYTWQQIANSDIDTLRSITRAKPNARPDEWMTCAHELAEKSDRLDAVYTGPLPDDLTRVDGIGPTYADVLYRAGICTFEQLAAALPAELAEILPTPAIGTEFDFEHWIEQAVKFASLKQRNGGMFR